MLINLLLWQFLELDFCDLSNKWRYLGHILADHSIIIKDSPIKLYIFFLVMIRPIQSSKLKLYDTYTYQLPLKNHHMPPQLLTLCSGSVTVRWRLGLGWFGFTATNNTVQTAIEWECKQTEQNKKDYESSKWVWSLIPSWQIEFPGLVDAVGGIWCTVCIEYNIWSNANKNINLSYMLRYMLKYLLICKQKTVPVSASYA